MSFHIRLRFDGELSSRGESRLRERGRVSRGSLQLYEVDARSWPRLASILADEAIELPANAPRKLLWRDAIDWADEAALAGAVLVPDDVMGAANPESDYDPALPAPHAGFVPVDRPIRVPHRPSGHLAGVGEEQIVSDRLAEALDPRGETPRQPVFRGDAKVAGWSRLLFEARCRVLDAVSLAPERPCAICGAPNVPSIGVWIAAFEPSLDHDVAVDTLGYGHLGHEHPVVVSVDRARRLAANFPTGLALDPVWAHDSAAATLARAILEDLADLA